MVSDNFLELDSTEYDVLKEIGNIGAGNATTALASMLSIKLDMSVPKVDLLEFNQLIDKIGGAENLIVSVLCQISEDVEGMILFMVDVSDAHHLINILLGKELDCVKDFDELELSAIHEISNIMIGSYLSSIATLTGLKIVSSIPHMCIDMAGAILSVPAIEFGKHGDKALMIESKINDQNGSVSGYFMLIPKKESYIKMLKALGIGC